MCNGARILAFRNGPRRKMKAQMPVERHPSSALFSVGKSSFRPINYGTREQRMPADQLVASNLSFLINQNVDKDKSFNPRLAEQSGHLRRFAVCRVLE